MHGKKCMQAILVIMLKLFHHTSTNILNFCLFHQILFCLTLLLLTFITPSKTPPHLLGGCVLGLILIGNCFLSLCLYPLLSCWRKLKMEPHGLV
eukprot:11602614-Karenia_brevis.AAC.1